MGNKIKVSIIVPVYNAETLITSTMHTLCQSELKEIEIIAVNDGSKDNSLTVLQKCAEKDSRIKVINKENGGIFDARNYGLKAATGEYICFCDQDDIVEPQMYAKMYQTAKGKDCELVMCSTGRIVNGQKMPYSELEECFLTGKDVKDECFLPLAFGYWNIYQSKRNLYIISTIWQCMVSHNFLEKNELSFRRFVSFEDDRLFLLDILARANRVALIPDIFYYWTVKSDSESHAPSYVDDLYDKDIKFQNEVINIMHLAKCSESDIQLYINLYGSFRYTRMVWNETVHAGASIGSRLKIIKKIYGEKDFRIKVKTISYYPRNKFARKIVGRLLKIHMVFMAYLFTKIYTKIQSKGQNRIIWVKLEKKAMG